MLQEIKAKEMKASARKMNGLSEQLMDNHYNILYKGYVNKVNEIRQKLQSVDRSQAHHNYSEYRNLKVEESFNLNGVRLHEDYFENLGGPGGQASGKLLSLIQRDFGSYEVWEKDFRACGMSGRGWAILAYDLDQDALVNCCTDTHHLGNLWNAVPILVLDMYEHAYYLDYGPKRAPYIDAFMSNVDWDVTSKRLEKLGIK